MKRITKMLLVVMVVILCFCGCEALAGEPFEPREGDAMVIIAGRHANARMYTEDVLEDTVGRLIDKCITTYRDGESYCARVNIKVIVSDGNPEQVPITYKGEEVPMRIESLDSDILMDKVNDTKNYITQFLMSEDLKADDEEVDLLAAISEASIILKAKPGVENHLIILDTGIVTAGPMNMRTLDIQSGTVDEVLSDLAEGAFCDLNDINVQFIGLGNVATGQTAEFRKDSVVIDRLVNLWTAYFVECADSNPLVEEIKFAEAEGVEMIHDEESDLGYPHVSNVVFKLSENKNGNRTEDGGGTSLVINSLELKFKKNDWVFENEENAREALRGYGVTFEYLKNSNDKIYVVGSIAMTKYNTPKKTSDISKKRAEAVKGLIVSEYGIDPERIIVIDAGTTEFSWRNGKEFPDGPREHGDPGEMQKNRVVAIIPESDEEYMKELREKEYVD